MKIKINIENITDVLFYDNEDGSSVLGIVDVENETLINLKFASNELVEKFLNSIKTI